MSDGASSRRERSRRKPLQGRARLARPHAPGELYILSRAAVRQIDHLAVEEFAIPAIVLMENAARHLADITLDLLENVGAPGVLVVCGPGNNGGDGLAAARHLHNAGLRVGIVLAQPVEAFSGEAVTQWRIVQRMRLPVWHHDGRADPALLRRAAEELGGADLMIDALLGTGLSAPVRQPARSLIDAMNLFSGAPNGPVGVLSADIPSGLDTDTGEPAPVAVRADVTVTFVALKPGLCTLESQAYVGDLIVADVGAPRELIARLGQRIDPPGHEPPGGPPRTRRAGRAKSQRPGDAPGR